MSAPAESVPRIGGVVLLRNDGAVLLQLRDNKPTITAAGLWVFPGGHCEDGEACRDCARREFREETGYDCPDLKPLTEFSPAGFSFAREPPRLFSASRFQAV